MTTSVETLEAPVPETADVASETTTLNIEGLTVEQRSVLAQILELMPNGFDVQVNHLYEREPQMVTLTLQNIEAAIAALSPKQKEIVLHRIAKMLP